MYMIRYECDTICAGIYKNWNFDENGLPVGFLTEIFLYKISSLFRMQYYTGVKRKRNRLVQLKDVGSIMVTKEESFCVCLTRK